jgi:hypothetical protein
VKEFWTKDETETVEIDLFIVKQIKILISKKEKILPVGIE